MFLKLQLIIKFFFIFTFLFVHLVFTGDSFAQTEAEASEFFNEGVQSYNNQDFKAANLNFQKTVDIKKKFASPSELYNLANSYFKLNKFAESVAYYKLALLKNPNFEKAKDNLLLAKSKFDLREQEINDDINFFTKALNYLGKSKLFFLALFSYLIFCFLLPSIFKNPSTFLKFNFGVSILFSLFFSSLYIFTKPVSNNLLKLSFNFSNEKTVPAIIIKEKTEIYSSKNDESAVLTLLNEGEEVPVLEVSPGQVIKDSTSPNTDISANNWARVKLPSSRYGWASMKDLILIR